MEVTKTIEWDMGHRVPNHKNKCRNPHGHRYRLTLSLKGLIKQEPGTSDEGMVLDFSDVKALMRQHIENKLDHSFMIHEGDSLMANLANEHPELGFIKVPFIPTAENITTWCYQQLLPHIPPGIEISRLRLYETPNSWAELIL